MTTECLMFVPSDGIGNNIWTAHRLLVGVLMTAALFPGQILAQSLTGQKSIHSMSFATQQAASVHNHAESASDCISVVVYKAVETAGGGTARTGPPINPAEIHDFKSGERIVVSFTPTFESYVYFINRGPEGTRVIFPRKPADIRAILPDETRNQPLQFNDRVGREELIVVLSRERLSRLDEAIGKRDKLLDPRPHIVVKQRQTQRRRGQRIFEKSGLIAANTSRWSVVDAVSDSASGPKSSSRGLECLQDDGDSSVQVRPVRDEKGSYRFGPGQVGAFTMLFDHR